MKIFDVRNKEVVADIGDNFILAMKDGTEYEISETNLGVFLKSGMKIYSIENKMAINIDAENTIVVSAVGR